MHLSHHNDERSRAYKAPDKVCIQSQPASRKNRERQILHAMENMDHIKIEEINVREK